MTFLYAFCHFLEKPLTQEEMDDPDMKELMQWAN